MCLPPCLCKVRILVEIVAIRVVVAATAHTAVTRARDRTEKAYSRSRPADRPPPRGLEPETRRTR